MKVQYLSILLLVASILVYLLSILVSFISSKFITCSYSTKYCKECSHSQLPGCKLGKGCTCISGCQCVSGNCDGSCL